MQEIVADLHRRVPASRFELASDSGGNYCQTIVADYSKMRRLTYRLGEATSRAAEGSRIMVCGTLRDSFNDDSLTLELSFTYPLPIPALKTESSLANSWAEDNVLASIVHLLDGSVSHQQEDGLGCLLTNVPVSAITALELDGRNRSFSQGSGVLVVDSDPRVLRSISAALQALGCECHCSESVDDASGLLRHYEKYAVVILDISLANDGSFRLAQKVLKMPYSVRPRIIAMGDEADTGIGSRAATVGFDDYLTKPYSLDRLAALVNSARVH